MKTYKTLSPYVVFTINSGGQKKEYALKKGDMVELPEDNIVVVALLARRQIVEQGSQETATKKTNKKQK
jgi:hypothetical protein